MSRSNTEKIKNLLIMSVSQHRCLQAWLPTAFLCHSHTVPQPPLTSFIILHQSSVAARVKPSYAQCLWKMLKALAFSFKRETHFLALSYLNTIIWMEGLDCSDHVSYNSLVLSGPCMDNISLSSRQLNFNLPVPTVVDHVRKTHTKSVSSGPS